MYQLTPTAGALLPSRSDVERLLTPDECIVAGVMSRTEVHAEIGEIVAGLKPGRASGDEIIVFDSSGTALQDVAAAVAVCRRALEHGEGARFSFNA